MAVEHNLDCNCRIGNNRFTADDLFAGKNAPKYVITKATVQKYSDIVITAITCVRIPVLLAVFEGMCIHQSVMVGNTDGIFTLQIPLDILLSVIIIRFSMHRVRILQPKPEEKEITIKES